jgi:hypothetical protein
MITIPSLREVPFGGDDEAISKRLDEDKRGIIGPAKRQDSTD